MIARNYKTQEIKDTPHKVDVREMYNDASAQMMHITLQAGETLKLHKTPVDVTFYILEENQQSTSATSLSLSDKIH